jgi:hypothetical protein
VAGFIPSSYRCELRGLYTALLFLIEFGRYMSNDSDYTIQNSVEFLFYTDSESMINKLEFLDSYPSAQRRVVLDSDWDALKPLHALLQQTGVIRDKLGDQLKHVKAHQDRTTPYSKLSPEAKLNCCADEQATLALEANDPHPLVPFDPITAVQLNINGATITHHVTRQIREVISLPRYKKYLAERFHWPIHSLRSGPVCQVFDSILWSAFHFAYKKHSRKRRAFTNKLHLDKLPFGGRLHRWQPHQDHRCPSCLSDNEDWSHFLRCPCNSRKQWTHGLHKDLEDRIYPDLDPHLQDLLKDIIYRLTSPRQLPTPSDTSYLHLAKGYQDLIKEQQAIGWDNFLRGKWSNKWFTIQELFASRQPSPVRREVLMKKLHGIFGSAISIIWTHTHKLWLQRNQARHGAHQGADTPSNRFQARQKIHFLYGLIPQVDPSDAQALSWWPSPEAFLADHSTKQALSFCDKWRPVFITAAARNKVRGTTPPIYKAWKQHPQQRPTFRIHRPASVSEPKRYKDQRLTTDFGTYNFTCSPHPATILRPITHLTRPQAHHPTIQPPLLRGQPRITTFFTSTSKPIGGDHPT